MPIYTGAQKFKEIIGMAVSIAKVYHGSDLLFTKSLPPGTILFESATPGTYVVTIPCAGNYQVYCIGGGCGGWGGLDTSGMWTFSFANGGGSGAGFIGILRLTPGSYSVIVGKGGAYGKGKTLAAEPGGNSSCFNIIAGGGPGNMETSSPYRMYGGTLTTTGAAIVSSTLAQNGNFGGNMDMGTTTNSSGGVSLYNGYGAGGKGYDDFGSGNSDNGTNGYIKIVAVSEVKNDL